MNNNDHYVPQFLLRQFSNAKGRLHVFDKWNQRSFESNTRNVASERGFYDVKIGKDLVSFEPLMCHAEETALDALNSVVEKKSLAVLSNGDREKIAYFLAIQTLRTRAHRQLIAQIDDGLKETMPSKGIDPQQIPQGFFRSDEQIKRDSVLYLEMAEEFVPHFLAKDWCLNIAPPGTTFFISDAPVVRQNIDPPSPFRGNNGIASKGIQIYLPLSADIVLCLLCPTIIEPFRSNQREIAEVFEILCAIETGHGITVPPECVTYCNSLQVAYSERFVFSCVDDFSLARDMLSSNPELRQPKHIAVQ